MASLALPRFLETHQTRADHARKLEAVVREAGGNVQQAHKSTHTAVDSISLRGIPAVGRCCAGVIHGTNPATAHIKDEPWIAR